MPIESTVTAPRILRHLCRAAARFGRDEEGSFVIFGIYLLLMMLLVGGLSVDIMRHDYSRLQIQNTADAAVLAAADLDQTLDAEAVVRDYFDKAGLLQYLDDVTVTDAINSRSVSATASMDVQTMFITALGINEIPANAGAAATEEETDIEIALVLDISGSMGSRNRIDNMQDAAVSFVETMFPDNEDAAENKLRVSISIVPYNRQTAVPPIVLDAMTLQADLAHDYSSCVEFLDADYDDTALPFGQTRKQAGHIDRDSSRNRDDIPGSGKENNGRGNVEWNLRCRTDPGVESTVMSNDRDALIAQINQLTPDGGTRANVGMKWAMGFLDPSFRPVTQSLISANEVDASMSARPYDYDRDNTLKVIVVMTDGDNNDERRLVNDDYNGDTLSDVYSWTDGDGETHWSVHDPEPTYTDSDGDGNTLEGFYIPELDEWQYEPVGSHDARRLPWREVWARFSVKRHAYWFRQRQYNDWDDYDDWKDRPIRTERIDDPDEEMLAVCDAAKAKNVAIYAVGLEITNSHAESLRQCASNANNYFDVDGREIVYAFKAIANNINHLRLTQ